MADNLADVIATMREYLSEAPAGHCVLLVTGCVEDIDVSVSDLTRLLDSAEAGMRARDAALEEAAQLADEWDERDGVWGVGTAIRDLKGAA